MSGLARSGDIFRIGPSEYSSDRNLLQIICDLITLSRKSKIQSSLLPD